jgi:hypothetical protein
LEDPAETQYKESLDLLMKYMDANDIPEDMRVRAYEYVEYCRALMQHQYNRRVLEMLPATLRGAICQQVDGEWISRISCFNADNEDERNAFIMAIAVILEHVAFPPGENIYEVGDNSTCSKWQSKHETY